MKRLGLVSIAALLLFGAHLAISQQDFSKVELKTVHVAENIYMLDSGVAGNIGLSVGPDGILMVDDQFAPLAEKIRAATAAVGKGRLAAKESGAALPVITYDQSLSIHFNGEEIEVIHFPAGHTDGDSVIFFKGSNVVHMGDHFFNGRFPYVDLDSGGSVEGYMANVAKVIARVPADVKIIPGHGPLASIEDLKQFQAMMVETISDIRKLKQSGKSLEDAKKQGLPDKWKEWGAGFVSTDRWIETIYRSLGA